MTSPTSATQDAPAPATLPGHTVKRVLEELGRDLRRYPAGLPRIPLLALHAAQVRDAIVARCRVSPHAIGHHPQLAIRWAAALDGDIRTREAMDQVLADQRSLETLAVTLWPREGR
jgi:hypothetical protein